MCIHIPSQTLAQPKAPPPWNKKRQKEREKRGNEKPAIF